MRPPTTLLVSLVIAAAPLTGCIGSDGEDEALRKQRAEVTGVTGGIEGIVTDDAFQPVVGANVSIAERELVTRTASDGSFAFSRLIPGTYTIVVQAEGFVSATNEATVVRGEATAVDFIVTHLFTEEAFQTIHELVGFLECGFAWKEVGAAGFTVLGRNSLTACALPNLLVGGNATNDRFMHFFGFSPPLETMVYEMDWTSNSVTGDSALLVALEIRGFTNVNGSRIVQAGGPPPLYASVDRTQFEELQQNFTDRCDDGNDNWCGYNFFEDGWEFQVRVFAHWGCTELDYSLCPQFQQEFTHFVSGFLNAPAPEGYSIVQGS